MNTDDGDGTLPPFPGKDDNLPEEPEQEEETSNVYYLPGFEPPTVYKPLAQQRQERITAEIINNIQEYRGDFAVLGGVFRRFEAEAYVGPISEEEFVHISSLITQHMLYVTKPIISLLVAEGHRQFQQATSN